MISPHRCPVCKKPSSRSKPEAEACFPFCSNRCRQVDFHRWSDGQYAIVEDVHPEVAEFLRDDPDITVQDDDGGSAS